MSNNSGPFQRLSFFVKTSKLVQLSINCLLSILLGATFSVNVFTNPVEDAAHPPNSLNGVWPSSIGLFFFFSSLVVIPIGIQLDSAEDVEKVLRNTVGLAAMGFASWFAAAFGVTFSSPPLIFLGNMLLAVPLSALCIVVIEHATYWLPGQSGQAIGIVNIATGLGTIATASVFDGLLSLFHVPAAISVAALLLGATTLFMGLFLALPPDYLSPESVASRNERGSSMLFEFPRLTWRSTLRHPTFWLYVFIIISKRMTFPLLSYFFRIGHTYQVSQHTLLRWFQWANFFSLLFNYVSAVGTDYLKTESGIFSSGARNLAAIMLFGQVAGYAWLTQLVKESNFVGWAIVVAVTLTLTQAHLGIATLLAVDVFGRENLALIFGLGGGSALGVGEGISTVIISWVDGANGGVVHSPKHYYPFYVIGAVWSGIAFASMAYLRRNIRPRGDCLVDRA